MNKQRLLTDAEQLEHNEFYKLYLDKLGEFSKGRVTMLRDAPLDKVAKIQGELSAIDWVLSRPKDLIEKITKEETIG